MFNLFKKKENNLMPKDLDLGFISSVFVNIKQGTKIFIPEKCYAIISYKDKVYLELPAGNFYLDDKNLKDLFINKKNEKKKYVDLDLYVVNFNERENTFSYKDNIPYEKQKAKQVFCVKYVSAISDYKKFYHVIRQNFALVSAQDSVNFVNELVQENIWKYFSHKTLNSQKLTFETQEKIKNNVYKLLKSIGIDLKSLTIDFELKLKNHSKQIEKTENETNTLKNLEIKESVEVLNSKSANLDNSEIKETKVENNENYADLCPVCKHKIIAGSMFCHICGKKFN